jgi:hypothetical protein
MAIARHRGRLTGRAETGESSANDHGPTGSYPQTDLEEINGDLLEADFWPAFDVRTTIKVYMRVISEQKLSGSFPSGEDPSVERNKRE